MSYSSASSDEYNGAYGTINGAYGEIKPAGGEIKSTDGKINGGAKTRKPESHEHWT